MAEGDTIAFDRHVPVMFRQPGDPAHLLGPPWLPETVRDLTSLGSTVFLGLMLLLVLGYLAVARRRRALLLVPVSVLGGQVLSTILKLIFAPAPDTGPERAGGVHGGFPQRLGHARRGDLPDARRASRPHCAAPRDPALLRSCRQRHQSDGRHQPGRTPRALADGRPGRWCLGVAWAKACTAIADCLAQRGQIEAEASKPMSAVEIPAMAFE
jgi:undecaprenyl-diphosphatase